MENTAKIEFAIDLSNKEQLGAFANLFATLAGQTEVSKTQDSQEKPKTSAKKVTKQLAEPVIEASTNEEIEEAKAEVKQEEPHEEAGETKTVKIEDVRALLSSKVENHREAIKKKLTSYGANNVTSLKPELYAEFADFLNKL